MSYTKIESTAKAIYPSSISKEGVVIQIKIVSSNEHGDIRVELVDISAGPRIVNVDHIRRPNAYR